MGKWESVTDFSLASLDQMLRRTAASKMGESDSFVSPECRVCRECDCPARQSYLPNKSLMTVGYVHSGQAWLSVCFLSQQQWTLLGTSRNSTSSALPRLTVSPVIGRHSKMYETLSLAGY